VNEFVSRGLFEPNVERSTGLLRGRRDAMLSALDRTFPDDTRWSRPEGGYFLWLELPEGTRADTLLSAAEREGVTFVKGTDFGGAPNTARLAFSFASPDEIATGVERLASLLPALAV
jgi:2-aminoadipate transaminase